MDVDEQSQCVSKIIFELNELGKLEFPAYGSLYFANTSYVTGAELPSNPGYCIGPHCGGPWPNLSTYCDSLIDLGISRVPPPHLITKHPHWQEFHGSPTEHYDLLSQGRALLKAMARHPSLQDTAKPSLFHPCLHTDNIFVSENTPTTVTAIIDWQACSIEPAFHYADISPDFAQPRPHVQPERELSFKRDECGIRFDLGLIVFFGPMFKARRMDTAYLTPFRYCHRTWKDGFIRFRNEIIQTARRWGELGFEGACPVALLSEAECAKHMEEYKTFEEIQEWKESIDVALNVGEDGRVPAEAYEKMQALHLELLEYSVKHMFEGEGIDRDTQVQNYEFLKEVWPFDLPSGYKEELRRE
ncbi:uncharacterized protein J4E88_010841 [Alternaria novae-zelandiae]|uniref:uncharacterized protein n=1 Tax=Alternaria novae-zelandiae TaxID=430562 RepID=UPI0020C20BD2|nr:uncharacterized protein J4E88_010841 [Alternaria novae-zelandiae]KAI4663136.1 hypothetical protein J4E88_010841 [Alternaria novae-zelandiae]